MVLSMNLSLLTVKANAYINMPLIKKLGNIADISELWRRVCTR